MAEESLDLIEEFIKTRDELQKRSFSSVDWDVDYILMNETVSWIIVISIESSR